MECNRLELFLNEHEGGAIDRDSELHKHVSACRDCKGYLAVTTLLASQKEHLEKAPETILSTVRQRIHERRNRREYSSVFDTFRLFAKPAIAFSALFIVAAVFLYLKNSPIGVIDNLADRFNISEYRNIQTGDVLYVAKQINVGLTLNGDVKLGLDSNTVLQVRGKKKIALFRGQFRLSAGKRTITVETPNGVITLNNAKIKVRTTLTKENGNFKARTSCYVFEGNVEAGSREKSLVTPGQEIILAENGKVELRNSMPAGTQPDQIFGIKAELRGKAFTAKEQLCDCLYDIRYNSDGNPLHGKEMKENKFPVRIFWRNKEKYESMRRIDETFCFFNAVSGTIRNTGNSPGI